MSCPSSPKTGRPVLYQRHCPGTDGLGRLPRLQLLGKVTHHRDPIGPEASEMNRRVQLDVLHLADGPLRHVDLGNPLAQVAGGRGRLT